MASFEYYAGQDLAKTFDFSALCVIRVGSDREAWVDSIHQWPHVDYSVIFNDTEKCYQYFKWKKLAVDQGNVGEYAIEEYKKRGIPYEGIVFTANTKHAMVTLLVMLLQQGRLFFPRVGLEELKAQCKEQERILSANKAPLYDAPENRKDDQFWALCLALEAARKTLVAPKVRILSNLNFNPPKQIDWLAGYDSEDYRRRDRQSWE